MAVPQTMTLAADLVTTGAEFVPDCALCLRSPTTRDERWERFLALPERYGVLHCERCGLRWLSPRPDAAGCAVVYSAEHYFHSGGATDYAQHAARRAGVFASRITRLQAMGVQSVLDYGAATGEFVAVAQAAGWDAMGVEFSESARSDARAKGIVLLAPDAPIDRTFDAIHMSHVLEHMPEPARHLRWCFERLNPGGVLVVEVPQQFDNLADKFRRLTKKGGRQEAFDAFSVHHTYFFTPPTVQAMVEAAGFRVDAITTPQTPNAGASWSRQLVERFLAWSARARMTGDAIELWARTPPQL